MSDPGDVDAQTAISTESVVVYSDRWVTVTTSPSQNHGLLALNYPDFLTAHPSKPRAYDLGMVVYLDPAPDTCRAFSTRSWGMSPAGIVWARDWYRGLSMFGSKKGLEQYRKSFVMKIQGKRRRVGFTVERTDAFVEAVEKVCPGISSKHKERNRNEYALIHDA